MNLSQLIGELLVLYLGLVRYPEALYVRVYDSGLLSSLYCNTVFWSVHLSLSPIIVSVPNQYQRTLIKLLLKLIVIRYAI